MTQFEFYKSFQFILEILVAELLFVIRLRRRRKFVLRLAAGLALLVLFSYFFPVPYNNPFYCSFTFLVIFTATVLLNKFIFKENWLTVVFCCTAGYSTQHMAYELYNVMLTAMDIPASSSIYGAAAFTGPFANLFVAGMYAVIYVGVYFLAYFLFGSKITGTEYIRIETKFIFAFCIFILVIDIILNAVVVYNPLADGKLYANIISIYNIICCAVSLYLQFEVALRKRIQNELDAVQRMWLQAKEQYQVSKENIALINMKCHDFKHRVRLLGDGEVNKAAIEDIEKHIRIYDSSAETGNDALDVILTEKSLLCNTRGIRFTIIADGEKLDFMAKEDIYALFGNIVDNAIEAVSKLTQDKRVISLHIKMIGSMVAVRESNYFDGELEFNGDLPVTTKSDKSIHGYGLKSIKYICDRYGGSLAVTAGENVFNLSIMFTPTEAGA